MIHIYRPELAFLAFLHFVAYAITLKSPDLAANRSWRYFLGGLFLASSIIILGLLLSPT